MEISQFSRLRIAPAMCREFLQPRGSLYQPVIYYESVTEAYTSHQLSEHFLLGKQSERRILL